MPTPIEQTYLKVPCSSCGQVTPHTRLSEFTYNAFCEVCRCTNFPLSQKEEYYTGWEMAMFWQARYRAVVGCGVPVVATAVAGPANQIAMTVGDKTCWIDQPARKLAPGAPAVNVVNGTILLAEPIEGGMLVSTAAPLDMSSGFATDYTALREENLRESIDPNSIGTL